MKLVNNNKFPRLLAHKLLAPRLRTKYLLYFGITAMIGGIKCSKEYKSHIIHPRETEE